jgi:hypothetical protein
MGGAFALLAPLLLFFCPNDKALAARVLKEGGGGSGSSILARLEAGKVWYMGVVLDFRGNSSSSSGSLLSSTDDGSVEEELCRADADEDS